MIAIHDLAFQYPRGGFQLRVPSLTVTAGERLALIGPSGSGKTTLLHLIAGIKRPTQGTVTVQNVNVSLLSDAKSRAYRLRTVGMVFQDFGLLEYLSVQDNILLPYRIGNWLHLTREVRDRVQSLAALMGIADKLTRPIGHLSQGEKQRVAVCRAMLPEPPLLLADEPTGNLDPATKSRVLDAMLSAAKLGGTTVLTVTHDHGLLNQFDRVIDFMNFIQPPQAA